LRRRPCTVRRGMVIAGWGIYARGCKEKIGKNYLKAENRRDNKII